MDLVVDFGTRLTRSIATNEFALRWPMRRPAQRKQMETAVMRASAIALAFLLMLGTPAEAQDSASLIVGVWKLTSFARKEVGTEKTVQVFGENPTGYRVHTRGGHAFYMFLR